MTLFRQYAKSEAISTFIWAIVLGLTGYFTTYLWDAVRTSGALAELQKAMESAQGVIKGLMGGGLNLMTLDGWIQGYALGGWLSLPYVIFTALFVAGMVTREMDRRTMEFILSLPVSRAQLLVSRWLVLAGSLAAMHLVQLAGVWSAVAALDVQGSPGRYALAAINSLLLYLFLGSLMLLVSLYFDDYGRGIGALLGIGLGLNLFHLGTAEATGALKALREVLPFSLYDIQAIIMKGEVPWGDMLLLGGGAVLVLALSVWVFQRKQISV